LHLFAKEQPDLNWENDEARRAIYDSSMRFWLDKGVDGFRIDCVNMYSKGTGFQDAPAVVPDSFVQPAWCIYANGPRMHEFMREINDQVLVHYDAMTVGELPHTPDPKDVLSYVGLGDPQMNMVFQFDIVDLGQGSSHKYEFQEWKLSTLKEIVRKWQQFIEGSDGWTTAFCENHGGFSPCLHLCPFPSRQNQSTNSRIRRPRPLRLSLHIGCPLVPWSLSQDARHDANRHDWHIIYLPGSRDRHDQCPKVLDD
jgi:glycosidase